jgi:hypothetical protein
LADATAREIGWLTLSDALELTALFALRDQRRFRRAAGRWLRRYVNEHPDPTLDNVGLAVAHLSRLGGPEHGEALASLTGMARQATSQPSRPRVA